MAEKPTYEELEQRVQELEKNESEYKSSKEALGDSEAQYRLLFEHVNIGIFIAQNGYLKVPNPYLSQLLGYSLADLDEKPFSLFIHPEYQSIVNTRHQERLKGKNGLPQTYDFRVITKHGTSLWVQLSTVVIQFKGRPATLNFLHDITERKSMEETLRESEGKYRRLFETKAQAEELLRSTFDYSPTGKALVAPEGPLLNVNAALCRILGYSKEELLTKIFQDIIWPDDLEAVLAKNKQLLVGEIDTYEMEIGGFHKDESLVWAQINVSLVRNSDSLFFITQIQDITERKHVEKDLLRERERLASIIEGTNVGTWEWNVQTGETIFNERWAEIIGYSLEEISPVSIDTRMKFTHPDDLKNSRELLQRHFSGELDYYECEARMRHKNGEWVWVLDRGKVAVWTEDGKPLLIMGTHQDITERKRSENRLKKNEELYRTLFSDSHTPIFMVDEKNRSYIDVNQAALDFMECNREQLIGKSVYDSTPPENIKQAKKEHANFSEIKSLETNYLVNDKIKTLLLEVTPLELNGDRILIGIGQDITERKQAEAEREKLKAQLNQAQKMESVGRLAGGVAHDFNNMLGVILGHTELALLQADENHDLYDDLKEIQKAAQRSADTTKQLLAFARKQTISPRQIDLNDTVESMLNMLRRLIGEDIDLVWKPSVHLWRVKMDPTQIDQILVNLCVNARDAITGVGKLIIETGKKSFDQEYCRKNAGFSPGNYVLLAVSDNGCGMDKETLNNLFEPFFTTKDVGKGTGLGLATIYGIVKQNNGFINVYSEPGQGTTFKIYLPRLVAEGNEDKAVPEKKAAAGGTETILLVEDDPGILRMTRMMLERKGYTVLSAAAPAEAIDLAKSHADKIHLLMTDVVMPEMNGRELAGQIADLYPDIRLLFMSGYTSNVIAHHGVLDDGVAFIQKPFSMADMTANVREVLDKASDETQVSLS